MGSHRILKARVNAIYTGVRHSSKIIIGVLNEFLNQSINHSDCRLGLICNLLMPKLIVIFVAGISVHMTTTLYDMKFNDIKFHLKLSVLCDLKEKRKKLPCKVKHAIGKQR